MRRGARGKIIVGVIETELSSTYMQIGCDNEERK